MPTPIPPPGERTPSEPSAPIQSPSAPPYPNQPVPAPPAGSYLPARAGSHLPRRHGLRPDRYALDAAVCADLDNPGSRWGLWQGLLPVVAFFVVLVVVGGLAGLLHLPGAASSFVAYALLAGAVALAARPVVRASGSWGAALGWSRPRWSDVPWILLVTLGSYLARIIVAGVMVTTIRGLEHRNLSNLHVNGITANTIAVLVVAVVVAPPIEELMFRGLLLRAAMRRFGFHPAAIGSSLIFGICHAWQEPTLLSAAFLAINTGILGYSVCWYDRHTGRLAPGIGVHALSNAVAAAIALAAV